MNTDNKGVLDTRDMVYVIGDRLKFTAISGNFSTVLTEIPTQDKIVSYQGTNVSEAKATTNFQVYGVLYNWPAANNDCPTGWRLPSDEEWTKMENYLIANGYNYDGTTSENKIGKALAAIALWPSSTYTTGAIGDTNFPQKRNMTGFTAVPGEINLDVMNYPLGVLQIQVFILRFL